jgi:hypothetical protein
MVNDTWSLQIPPFEDGENSKVFAKLYVSKYAWSERDVWCKRMDKVGPVSRITHLMAENEAICKVQCTTQKKYQSKTSNIIAEVENMKSKKLKTMNLKKACKWWKEQSKKLKVLKRNIVTNH